MSSKSATTRKSAPPGPRADVSPAEGPDPSHVNAVTLRGRLADAPEPRELPSGDVLLTFRLVVDRPGTAPQSRRQVDTIDCLAWSARVQRTVRCWAGGESVWVEGRLRRRFRRTPGGATSRVEVEVTRARRVR